MMEGQQAGACLSLPNGDGRRTSSEFTGECEAAS